MTSLCPNFVRNHPPYTHTHTHTHSSDCGRSYVALYGRKRRKRRNRIEEPLALWQRCPGIISSFVRFFYFLALVLAKNKWNLHDTWVILHVNCFFWQTNKQIHKPAAGGKVGGCGSGSGWNAAIVIFSVFTATQAGRQAGRQSVLSQVASSNPKFQHQNQIHNQVLIRIRVRILILVLVLVPFRSSLFQQTNFTFWVLCVCGLLCFQLLRQLVGAFKFKFKYCWWNLLLNLQFRCVFKQTPRRLPRNHVFT